MSGVGKGIRDTTERRRGIYRQVKPRLQWISMRVQAAGEDRYSPWRRAPSSQASSRWWVGLEDNFPQRLKTLLTLWS